MAVFKASVTLVGLMVGVGVLLGLLELVAPEPSLRYAGASRVAVVGELPDPAHPRPPCFVP